MYGANGVEGKFGRLSFGTVVDVAEWRRGKWEKWDDRFNSWLKDSE